MVTAAPLTIRNVTSAPLELKSIGEFGHSMIASAEDAALSNKYQSGTTHQSVNGIEEVSVIIAPFETLKTEKSIRVEGLGAKHFRLEFRYQSEEHCLDVHGDRHESKELAAFSQNARNRLTAVYHPLLSHVTIFSSSSPNSWMKDLKRDTPVSALSIPGTHNAPAYHHAFPSVRCQAVSPKEQLENGVRFFDIRVRVLDPSAEKLELVHAIWPVSLTGRKYFRDLVDDVQDFLDKNPSETVLMTVKREGLGAATDQQLARVLYDHYASDASKWYTAPRVPYLGEVRGKIVLIRRFGIDDSLGEEYGGAGWCLDASSWADNTPDALTGSGDLRIQDFYGVMRSAQIKTKTEYVTGLMAKTSAVVSNLPPTATTTATTADVQRTTGIPEEGEKQPIHVNFLSASNFFNPRCWPEGIAAKLNPGVLEYLCVQHNEIGQNAVSQQVGAGDGCTGVVVCDWVGHKGNWDLVRAIVGWNARLVARETGVI